MKTNPTNRRSQASPRHYSARFTIVTKARTEGDSRTPNETRYKLRSELSELRERYLNKVDEIAMQCGVAEALKIKKQVEQQIDEFEQMRRGKGL